MVQPNREQLSETVEVDEALIGGLSEGSPGRGVEKALIVLADELGNPQNLSKWLATRSGMGV
ncbi:MAG: hypothetical protein LBR11_11290 [Deltaproteobacteria bacterium]|jgi:hypothetical protein|nr:hypothetical protein [Deltaproteobacteria bacterium]